MLWEQPQLSVFANSRQGCTTEDAELAVKWRLCGNVGPDVGGGVGDLGYAPSPPHRTHRFVWLVTVEKSVGELLLRLVTPVLVASERRMESWAVGGSLK